MRPMKIHALTKALGLTAVLSAASPAQQPGLAAPRPESRAAAFDALMKRPAQPGDAQVIADLLARENRLIDSVNAMAGASVSERYGEWYGEYVSSVLRACVQRCNRANPQVNRTIALAPYNADSEFGRSLAKDFGPDVADVLLERSRTGSAVRRASAIHKLALVGEHSPLSTTKRAAVIDGIRAAARAEDPGVRSTGVLALGRVGTREDLAMLQTLASSDTTRTFRRGTVEFPIRELARLSSDQIRARIPR